MKKLVRCTIIFRFGTKAKLSLSFCRKESRTIQTWWVLFRNFDTVCTLQCREFRPKQYQIILQTIPDTFT